MQDCDLISVKQDENKEVTRTISPAKLQPAKRDQVLVGRSNRFGFRQNTVRPTSSTIQPRISEYDDNMNNNNNFTNANKLRSKSASNTVQRTNVLAQAVKFEENLPRASNLRQNPTAVTREMNANTM